MRVATLIVTLFLALFAVVSTADARAGMGKSFGSGIRVAPKAAFVAHPNLPLSVSTSRLPAASALPSTTYVVSSGRTDCSRGAANALWMLYEDCWERHLFPSRYSAAQAAVSSNSGDQAMTAMSGETQAAIPKQDAGYTVMVWVAFIAFIIICSMLGIVFV